MNETTYSTAAPPANADTGRAGRRIVAVVLLAVAVVALSSCVGEPLGPTIDVLSVSPSSLAASETASTDFEVTMTVSGFEGQIVEADAFIELQSESRSSQNDDFDVQGNTVILEGVSRSWFNGLEPGDYDVGAQIVTNAGEDVTQGRLATVSITP